ncbi:MAG: enoyl-[acyl-carrier-protein] reductase, partial [Thermoanaerobaculales bacterium]|nr:enoyl-[acyl-carrier-protein] reductase [Thermoanaerobaculales bacterium]
LAEAGASVCLGSWPPALGIFQKLLERGKIDASMTLSDGRKMEFEKIYPLDAAFDSMADVPADIRESKRYQDFGDFTIQGVVEHFQKDFGDQPLDIVVHSLANGPEVKNQLLDTSRAGYLSAVSVSAYSNVSFVRHFGPLMRDGGSFLSLTYMAGERAIPGYGGGMSTAKAALEADTRTLAFEAGRRFGIRINTISAGPFASRAASAIGFIDMMIDYCSSNAPLTRKMEASDVGNTAAFLASPMAAAITGSVVYVDNGYHAMGMAVSPESLTTPQG